MVVPSARAISGATCFRVTLILLTLLLLVYCLHSTLTMRTNVQVCNSSSSRAHVSRAVGAKQTTPSAPSHIVFSGLETDPQNDLLSSSKTDNPRKFRSSLEWEPECVRASDIQLGRAKWYRSTMACYGGAESRESFMTRSCFFNNVCIDLQTKQFYFYAPDSSGDEYLHRERFTPRSEFPERFIKVPGFRAAWNDAFLKFNITRERVPASAPRVSTLVVAMGLFIHYNWAHLIIDTIVPFHSALRQHNICSDPANIFLGVTTSAKQDRPEVFMSDDIQKHMLRTVTEMPCLSFDLHNTTAALIEAQISDRHFVNIPNNSSSESLLCMDHLLTVGCHRCHDVERGFAPYFVRDWPFVLHQMCALLELSGCKSAMEPPIDEASDQWPDTHVGKRVRHLLVFLDRVVPHFTRDTPRYVSDRFRHKTARNVLNAKEVVARIMADYFPCLEAETARVAATAFGVNSSSTAGKALCAELQQSFEVKYIENIAEYAIVDQVRLMQRATVLITGPGTLAFASLFLRPLSAVIILDILNDTMTRDVMNNDEQSEPWSHEERFWESLTYVDRYFYGINKSEVNEPYEPLNAHNYTLNVDNMAHYVHRALRNVNLALFES